MMDNYNDNYRGEDNYYYDDNKCMGYEYDNCGRKPKKDECKCCADIILSFLLLGLGVVIGIIVGAVTSATILGALAAIIVLAVVLAILIIIRIITLICCGKCFNKKW